MASDVHERVTRFLRSRPDVTTADLAAASALGESTVKNYVAGRMAETARIREEMERVMRLVDQGDILQPGGGRAVVISEQQLETVRRVSRRNEFYVTETVRKIAQVLEYCSDQAAIGVVTGDYGVGKTEALNAWRRGEGRKIEAIVFEFDEFSASNKVAFIQALAEGLGLPSKCGMQDAVKIFRAIVTSLRQTPCLLIFDQCEMARPRVLQIIRQIWDRTREEGVGVVLLAAPVLLAKLKNSQMQDVGALTSRVGVWAALRGLGRAEMAAIVKQEGIADVDEAAFDLWWKATGGSMRRLLSCLDMLKAKHQGKRITEKTIAGVAGHLWGMAVRTEAA